MVKARSKQHQNLVEGEQLQSPALSWRSQLRVREKRWDPLTPAPPFFAVAVTYVASVMGPIGGGVGFGGLAYLESDRAHSFPEAAAQVSNALPPDRGFSLARALAGSTLALAGSTLALVSTPTLTVFRFGREKYCTRESQTSERLARTACSSAATAAPGRTAARSSRAAAPASR